MGSHEILAPALQKYYSALKSLDDFGRGGDFLMIFQILINSFRNLEILPLLYKKGFILMRTKKYMHGYVQNTYPGTR